MGLLELENTWDSFAFADFDNASLPNSAACQPPPEDKDEIANGPKSTIKKVESVLPLPGRGSGISMLQRFSFGNNSDSASSNGDSSSERLPPVPLPPPPEVLGRRHSEGDPYLLKVLAQQEEHADHMDASDPRASRGRKKSQFDFFGEDAELQAAEPKSPLIDFEARIERDRAAAAAAERRAHNRARMRRRKSAWQ